MTQRLKEPNALTEDGVVGHSYVQVLFQEIRRPLLVSAVTRHGRASEIYVGKASIYTLIFFKETGRKRFLNVGFS